MKLMDRFRTSRFPSKGFTLVELMVVILIILVLAMLVTLGANRFLEKGRKVQAMAQFRDFQVGMSLFEGDYQKPPIPKEKRDYGWDIIYSDPNGDAKNGFLVGVLAGEDKDYPYQGRSFSTKDTNPRAEAYMTFPFAPNKKSGVGKDGNLYDPWGHEVLVAVNSLSAPGQDLLDSNGGNNDRLLSTFRFGEYTDTKPKEQSFVFWSYGKDGKKGKSAPNNQSVVPLVGSDDVISW
jgi:prepilin-type N-terminal cleavage/methylation domain-containing protein